MNPIQKFQRFLRYETQATARSLAAIESIPPASRQTPEATRARAILAHLQLARRVWLSRLGGAEPITVTDWFPAWEIDRIRAEAAALDDLWARRLASLDEPALARTVEYKSMDGKPFASLTDDIITQVFNHSSYHRGQVAMLVAQAGGERPATDYIFLAREGLLD